MTEHDWIAEYNACVKRAQRFELNREPAHATTQWLQAAYARDQAEKIAAKSRPRPAFAAHGPNRPVEKIS